MAEDGAAHMIVIQAGDTNQVSIRDAKEAVHLGYLHCQRRLDLLMLEKRRTNLKKYCSMACFCNRGLTAFDECSYKDLDDLDLDIGDTAQVV